MTRLRAGGDGERCERGGVDGGHAGKYTLLDARKELKEGVAVRDLVIAALPNPPR